MRQKQKEKNKNSSDNVLVDFDRSVDFPDEHVGGVEADRSC